MSVHSCLRYSSFVENEPRLGFYVNPTSPRLVYTGRNYIVTRGILWPRNTRTLSITVGNRKPSKNAWAVTKHVFNYTLRRIGAAGDTQLRSTSNIFFLWRWIVKFERFVSRNVIIEATIYLKCIGRERSYLQIYLFKYTFFICTFFAPLISFREC